MKMALIFNFQQFKMANFQYFSVLFTVYALCLFSFGLWSSMATEDRKVYIAYMGSVSEDHPLSSGHHIRILQQVIHGRNAKESLIRSYGRSFNGFAAKLTTEESENLKKMEGVVSVFPSKTLHFQTTRSWDFLGFPQTVHVNATSESDIIVGVIDSGIWPESPSFSDDGFGPAPKKWKGVCQGGLNFTCNNKLIGARTYRGVTSRDQDGHGTHTASIAAGRIVDGASFYGIAGGSARGGAPFARIAAYKACDIFFCNYSDILAAFDDAIADGVDLIIISLGHYIALRFYRDSIAIGAFHAMEKGILTVAPAGNYGDGWGLIDSVAPWIFTVAASTTDRRITTKVVLGDGKTLTGKAINSLTLKEDNFPLIHGKDGSITGCEGDPASACDCLNKTLVEGKIVVCDTIAYNRPEQAGAVGSLEYTVIEDFSYIPPLPGALLGAQEYGALLSYLKSTKAPVANILKSDATNDTNAPVVAVLSSRGPSFVAFDILKPDISAPGVDILAAFSPMASVSGYASDKRSASYSVRFGTSISCPHVAGAAAYLKSLHPDWSPAAIKSALMTTAHPMSPSKNPDAEFAYGSGHLNPMGATNPGLVYEATKDDYLSFLCKLGYNDERIRLISGDKNFSCPKMFDQDLSPKDVNYPSMSASVDSGSEKPFSVKFQRTVTNVGVANSTYMAKVESGSEMKVTVEPNSLSFKSLNEQKSFNVTVVGDGLPPKSKVSASLTWSDGIHSVRSPIVVYTQPL